MGKPIEIRPKQRPILFSGEMVRAILRRNKTQTRRLMPPRTATQNRIHPTVDKYGRPGEQLWVRETWADVNTMDGPAFLYKADGHMQYCHTIEWPIRYERYRNLGFACWWEDVWNQVPGNPWKPSIFMPRDACRLQLNIGGVGMERLQNLTASDAIAEGVFQTIHGWRWSEEGSNFAGPVEAYADLWDRINPANPWSSDPSVLAIHFKRSEVTS